MTQQRTQKIKGHNVKAVTGIYCPGEDIRGIAALDFRHEKTLNRCSKAATLRARRRQF